MEETVTLRHRDRLSNPRFVLHFEGENTPPMYGDYEAQRHWMEIALNVPAVDWYTSTAENDIMYWGLDYPPLSGYVSWLFGKLVGIVEPGAVRLNSSRGFEDQASRAAMRFTVLIGDLLIFFPGVLLSSFCLSRKAPNCSKQATRESIREAVSIIAFCGTLPALILIDHGHFQYNGISLGLFLISMSCFMMEMVAIGAAFLCMSIYFKHMGLYYGLALFSYLTSRMLKVLRDYGPFRALLFASKVLLSIAVTTLISFAPWISERRRMLELLGRLFPLSRGLYEDKVANVWCSISVIVKLNKILEPKVLFRFCSMVTVVASLPFCIAVAIRPTDRRLFLAAGGCALSAYLFSYQVHEKQVLIPLLPIALLFDTYPAISTWTSLIATFSLFPLLLREGLVVPYGAVLAIHIAVVLYLCGTRLKQQNNVLRWVGFLATLFGVGLNVSLCVGSPPTHAPDLFVLLNTIYACGHLCLLYVVLLYTIWTEDDPMLSLTEPKKLSQDT